MTRSSAPRLGALLAAIALVLGAAGWAFGPAAAASASLGSVPPEVAAYVSGGAMVTRLNDVYGPNAAGNAGIKFDDTTKAGPISRVYEWTAARLANQATDHPVQLTNNWVVPITIGGRSVGLATIWINPQTVAAELAEFAPSAELGTALTTVPATAALVRDPATGAWLALADGTVTPLVAGRSGLTGPVPVASMKLSSGAPAPIATTEPNTGLALVIGIVALIVIIIVVALLLPRRRGAKKPAHQDAAAEPSTPEVTVAGAGAGAGAGAAAGAVAAESAEPAAAAAPRKSAPPKPPAPKAATPKPAGPRPSGRTPTTSAAAKPASSKPPASRSAGSKALASKPRASKPPAAQPPVSGPPTSRPASQPPAPKQPPRPRTPKPPADPGSDSSPSSS